MSVKKLLVLAAGVAVMGATAAMAGGPDHMAMPAQPAFQNSIYLEGHLGYAWSNWGQVSTTTTENGTGGFTGGADLGYNYTQNLAFEAGWFYLPRVSGTALVRQVGRTATSQGLVYLAAKLSAPIMDSFDLFAKAGVGYRYLTNTGVSNGNYWLPVFAGGAQYNYGQWIFGAQYTFVTGNFVTSSGGSNDAQQAQLLTGFVGYKFNV